MKGSRDIFLSYVFNSLPSLHLKPFFRASRVPGPLRAKSVSEDPVGVGQEWAHRGGQRAPLQVSRGSEPAERRVQVSNATATTSFYKPQSASLSIGQRGANDSPAMIDSPVQEPGPRIWSVVPGACGQVSMSVVVSWLRADEHGDTG